MRKHPPTVCPPQTSPYTYALFSVGRSECKSSSLNNVHNVDVKVPPAGTRSLHSPTQLDDQAAIDELQKKIRSCATISLGADLSMTCSLEVKEQAVHDRFVHFLEFF
jgi:hypothetical protein